MNRSSTGPREPQAKYRARDAYKRPAVDTTGKSIPHIYGHIRPARKGKGM